ncbi:1026_t:CDS:2 [Ambispora leptoticha]|uniref:1026_t:CDS:1 n=1 Tax=Ambispora leptoticha TaxID=144679 RepID=A0A9N8VJQ1_9GLOM|nr:1026_t:CDS:2 [Ambispora leptoticha]
MSSLPKLRSRQKNQEQQTAVEPTTDPQNAAIPQKNPQSTQKAQPLRRQRIVRQPSLWERIFSAPLDYLIMIINDYDSFDWDALLTAIALNCMLIIVKICYRFDRPEFSSEYKRLMDKSSYALKLELAEYGFLMTSIINFIYLAVQTKKYQMFCYRKLEQPATSNAHLVNFNKDTPSWADSYCGRILYPICSYFFKSDTSLNRRQIWELNMWNPSSFSLHLFCYFSPPQVMVLMGLNSENWQYYLPIAAFIALQVYVLVKIYTTHIKDKQVLFSEVTYEYDNKFVYPTIFKKKNDVATQTDPLIEWDIVQ